MYFAFKKNNFLYIMTIIVCGVFIIAAIKFNLDILTICGWGLLILVSCIFFAISNTQKEIDKINDYLYDECIIEKYQQRIERLMLSKLKFDKTWEVVKMQYYVIGLIYEGDFDKIKENMLSLLNDHGVTISKKKLLQVNYYIIKCLYTVFIYKKEQFLINYKELKVSIDNLNERYKNKIYYNTYQIYQSLSIIYDIVASNNVMTNNIKAKLSEVTNFVKSNVLYFLIVNDLIIDESLKVEFENARGSLFYKKDHKGVFYRSYNKVK